MVLSNPMCRRLTRPDPQSEIGGARNTNSARKSFWTQRRRTDKRGPTRCQRRGDARNERANSAAAAIPSRIPALTGELTMSSVPAARPFAACWHRCLLLCRSRSACGQDAAAAGACRRAGRPQPSIRHRRRHGRRRERSPRPISSSRSPSSTSSSRSCRPNSAAPPPCRRSSRSSCLPQRPPPTGLDKAAGFPAAAWRSCSERALHSEVVEHEVVDKITDDEIRSALRHRRSPTRRRSTRCTPVTFW